MIKASLYRKCLVAQYAQIVYVLRFVPPYIYIYIYVYLNEANSYQ